MSRAERFGAEMALPRRVLSVVALFLVMCAVSFAVATLRTLERGQAELGASDAAFNRGELEPAVRHARRAALLYVPSASHVDAAYERLRAIARGSERARDMVTATGAWQAMRAAAIETTHAWRPRETELVEATRNLERLLGVPMVEARGAPSVAGRAFGSLLVVGFSCFGLGLSLLLVRAHTARGGWVHARAHVPAFLVLAGAVCAALALSV